MGTLAGAARSLAAYYGLAVAYLVAIAFEVDTLKVNITAFYRALAENFSTCRFPLCYVIGSSVSAAAHPRDETACKIVLQILFPKTAPLIPALSWV
ncbi:hypothetical protein FB567DRAFT_232911 [Paraphoma chrysanthemicola]|uniref:Uncharacterized protein n=1 Tax=Paraphoma chrysanthemicola TaxID=798071 RepID=A0A8K0RCN6_9PLEO|nr:hypothetical protein FB567DRAFT_232911 [Paraphoma chrysanthemicola]